MRLKRKSRSDPKRSLMLSDPGRLKEQLNMSNVIDSGFRMNFLIYIMESNLGKS